MNHNLQQISDMTINHYQRRAQVFWESTKDHDVSQNISALLSALDNNFALNRYKILDFGCGPGRDLLTFKKSGHDPVGLDGCEKFTEHAQRLSGCPVWTQNFFDLQLPERHFHGIFANASFFQIPSTEMSSVLEQLNRTLMANGILFMSNPRGSGEGYFGDRYATYLEIEQYTDLLHSAGFSLLRHYYRPTGLPLEEQPWLAIVATNHIPGEQKQI